MNPIDHAALLLCAGLLLIVAWLWGAWRREAFSASIFRGLCQGDSPAARERAKTGGEGRSPQWPALRRKFLAGKVCAACGKSDQLEAHHVKNFREHPDLELEETNLLALCEHPSRTCHWHVGHNALEWRTCNPHAVEDAAQFLERRRHAA